MQNRSWLVHALRKHVDLAIIRRLPMQPMSTMRQPNEKHRIEIRKNNIQKLKRSHYDPMKYSRKMCMVQMNTVL